MNGHQWLVAVSYDVDADGEIVAVLASASPEVGGLVPVISHFVAAAVTLVTVSAGPATGTRVTKLGPRDNVLVSTQWLASHLSDGNLVLLHVGDPSEYPAEHLPARG